MVGRNKEIDHLFASVRMEFGKICFNELSDYFLILSFSHTVNIVYPLFTFRLKWMLTSTTWSHRWNWHHSRALDRSFTKNLSSHWNAPFSAFFLQHFLLWLDQLLNDRELAHCTGPSHGVSSWTLGTKASLFAFMQDRAYRAFFPLPSGSPGIRSFPLFFTSCHSVRWGRCSRQLSMRSQLSGKSCFHVVNNWKRDL